VGHALLKEGGRPTEWVEEEGPPEFPTRDKIKPRPDRRDKEDLGTRTTRNVRVRKEFIVLSGQIEREPPRIGSALRRETLL